MTGYKLTDQKMQTFDNFQWELNVVKVPEPTKSKKGLCGPGWLHFYQHPLIAVVMNPRHAGLKNPRLFECIYEGDIIHEPLMSGCTQMTLLKELDIPYISVNQRVKFGILCALEVYKEEKFTLWAKKWLDGSDRNKEAASLMSVAAAQEAYILSADTSREFSYLKSYTAASASAIAASVAYDDKNDIADAANYASYTNNKSIDFVKLAKQAMES